MLLTVHIVCFDGRLGIFAKITTGVHAGGPYIICQLWLSDEQLHPTSWANMGMIMLESHQGNKSAQMLL